MRILESLDRELRFAILTLSLIIGSSFNGTSQKYHAISFGAGLNILGPKNENNIIGFSNSIAYELRLRDKRKSFKPIPTISYTRDRLRSRVDEDLSVDMIQQKIGLGLLMELRMNKSLELVSGFDISVPISHRFYEHHSSSKKYISSQFEWSTPNRFQPKVNVGLRWHSPLSTFFVRLDQNIFSAITTDHTWIDQTGKSGNVFDEMSRSTSLQIGVIFRWKVGPIKSLCSLISS